MLVGVMMSFFLATGQTYTIADSTKSIIDSTYNALIKKAKVVGASIAIVDNGKIVYATGYGFQDEENNIKADEHSIYRIGSCTKSFTALSVMQMHDQGRLNVDNSLKSHLPGFKVYNQFDPSADIKIHNVLTHTSGLPSDLLNGFFCDNPPASNWVLDQTPNLYMAAPIGYQHSYSNFGYGLLGELIEQMNNVSYEAYLKKNIFGPLDMTESFVLENPGLQSKISKGYVDKKEVDEALIRDQAAGLIHSSTYDMAKYLIMYLNRGEVNGKQLVSEESIRKMEENGAADITLKTTSSWGYGLYSSKVNVIKGTDTSLVTVIGHGGDTWAFHADFKYIPELGVGAVVLTNTDKGTRINSAYRLLKIYLDSKENAKLKTKRGSADNTKSEDKLCTKADIQGGIFAVSSIPVVVDNPDKIVFKQGPAKIIMQPMDDSLNYKAKLRLFGVVPMKVKGQTFKFVRLNDDIYMKVVYTSINEEDYVARKVDKQPIPDVWENRFGTYELTGDFFECKDCRFVNFEGLTAELTSEDDILVLKLKGKTNDTRQTIMLEVVSDNVCVSQGVGRNTGDTVRILENGNLYYSGFELKKK